MDEQLLITRPQLHEALRRWADDYRDDVDEETALEELWVELKVVTS